jgi:hypothetical protein
MAKKKTGLLAKSISAVNVIEIAGGELMHVASFPDTKDGNAAAEKFFRDSCVGGMEGDDHTKDEINDAVESSGHFQDEVTAHCGSMERDVWLYRPSKM